MTAPCCDCYDNNDLNAGAWSKEEDQKLINHVTTCSEVCRLTLPQAAGLLRCGKCCRKRWFDTLSSDHERENFGEDEDDLIIRLHALLGDRWSLIAGRLPGRTDNEIKSYWNSHLKKKLVKMGIDPNNHRLPHGFAGTSSNKSRGDCENIGSRSNYNSREEDQESSSSGPVVA
ncbi:Myb-related protein 308-like protein [Tanacetum coccineum]